MGCFNYISDLELRSPITGSLQIPYASAFSHNLIGCFDALRAEFYRQRSLQIHPRRGQERPGDIGEESAEEPDAAHLLAECVLFGVPADIAGRIAQERLADCARFDLGSRHGLVFDLLVAAPAAHHLIPLPCAVFIFHVGHILPAEEAVREGRGDGRHEGLVQLGNIVRAAQEHARHHAQGTAEAVAERLRERLLEKLRERALHEHGSEVLETRPSRKRPGGAES